MSESVDLTPAQMKTLRSLLQRHLPGVAAWAYGSRVKWTSRPESDLDLVVFSTPEQQAKVSALREAFDESNLPFRVDLFVWDEVPEKFRKTIKAERLVVQEEVERGEAKNIDGWDEVELGELIDVKHGFAFKGEHFRNEPPGDILLTPGNFAIGGGFKYDKLKYYAGPVPEDYVLAPGDLLVTMTDLSKAADTLGYPAVVPMHQGGPRYLHNQRLGLVIIKEPEKIHKRFLYYLMCTRSYRHDIVAGATGTTVKHTSPTKIRLFRTPIPPPKNQEAIAEILGSLDDKIELNRRMNETLEAMARAIFKSWFVDFDPVRAKAAGQQPRGLAPHIAALFPDAFEDSEFGEIPKGWHVDSVYTIADVIYGAPFKSALFNDNGDGRPLIRIRDLATHDPKVFTPEEHLKGYVVRPGDLIVGMAGEFHAHLWRGPESWLNQRVCCFQPIANTPRAFVHYSIEGPLQFFEGSKTGTTVIHLSKGDIDTFRIVVPTPTLLQQFSEFVGPVDYRVVSASAESRTLSALRDALLPKLISGELRVRDAGRIVGRCV